MARKWLAKAAMIWCDMERGLYKWEGSTPRHADGSYRVVRSRILTDLGMHTTQKGSAEIWDGEEFQGLLKKERARRDTGIADAIELVEREVGPIRSLTETAWRNVIEVFERQPDSDDPLALSPAQYVKEYREYLRLGLEVEGKLDSVKRQGVHAIAQQLYADRKLTSGMVEDVAALMERFNRETEQHVQALKLGDDGG